VVLRVRVRVRRGKTVKIRERRCEHGNRGQGDMLRQKKMPQAKEYRQL
jgi:hypothetical protein